MKITGKPFLPIISALLLAIGCSHKEAQTSSGDSHAFDNAPPELKQKWETALAADKSNDYVTTVTVLEGLLREKLSFEQADAVGNKIKAVNERLSAAVKKGDPAAKSALEELQRNASSRRRR